MGGGGEASGKGILVTHPSSLSWRAQAVRCLGECRFLSAPGLCTFVASGHWVNCSHVTFPVPQEGTNNQSHAVQCSNRLLLKLLGWRYLSGSERTLLCRGPVVSSQHPYPVAPNGLQLQLHGSQHLWPSQTPAGYPHPPPHAHIIKNFFLIKTNKQKNQSLQPLPKHS